MKLKFLILTLAVLLLSCGTRDETDIRSFDDLLAFMTGNAENTVTGVSLSVESAVSDGDPILLSDTDSAWLLSLLTENGLTVERYEPEHIYGGSSYVVTLTLSDGGIVELCPDKNQLMVYRQERNEEQQWVYAPYRLNTDAYPDFYTAVGEIWVKVSDEEPATH